MGNAFANINLNDFRGSGGGAYITDEGQFLIRLKEVKFKGKQNNPNATRFIVDFEVVESSIPDKVPVGARRGNVIKVGDHEYPETALGNMADCIRAFGVSFDLYYHNQSEFTADTYDVDRFFSWHTGPDQPLKGVVVGLETVNITTRKNNIFTKHQYFVPTLEQIARHRA